MAGAEQAPLVKELPAASQPPDSEPQDSNVDVDLSNCTPYVLTPGVRTIDIDLMFYPSTAIRVEQLAIEVAAHFHGVSHPSAEVVRHPYATSCVEGAPQRFHFCQLARAGGASQQAHYVSCHIELARVPLGISCITLTVSGERLDLCRAIVLSTHKVFAQAQGRFQFGHKTIDDASISHTLQSAQQVGGTMTLAAVVMNCGWWHIYSSQSFFVNTAAQDFIQKACYPRRAGDTALTRSERLLSYWQQYKPLTRQIKVHVVEAFQLPIAKTSFLKMLTCNSTKPKVQSRVVGVYPGEQPSGAGATLAESYRPNTTGAVELRPHDWIAERVMASDPRHLEVVLLHNADSGGNTAALDVTKDPNFLGVARISLGQCWELLPFNETEVKRRLRVKLGPRENTQCSGTVIVQITVTRDEYVAGVEFMKPSP